MTSSTTNHLLPLLRSLTAAPSPSGSEQPVQRVVRAEAARLGLATTTDVLGNAYFVVNGKGEPSVMLAAHADEIGFIVTSVSTGGYLYFDSIGGHDSAVTVGQRVRVHLADGRSMPGTIGRKPIHLMTDDERGRKLTLTDLYVDVGAVGSSSGTDAGKVDESLVGPAPGDPIIYDAPCVELGRDLVMSAGLDDKAGLLVVLRALELISSMNPIAAKVTGVSTVQEELGHRGARTASYAIQASIGIAVDVTHASDVPGVDSRHVGEVKLGGGPVITRGPNINTAVLSRLLAIAKDNGIAVQANARGSATRTDLNAMQINQSGMATALIGVPLRYMHTPGEIVSLSDIEGAALLIAHFCASLSTEDSFKPSFHLDEHVTELPAEEAS